MLESKMLFHLAKVLSQSILLHLISNVGFFFPEQRAAWEALLQELCWAGAQQLA